MIRRNKSKVIFGIDIGIVNFGLCVQRRYSENDNYPELIILENIKLSDDRKITDQVIDDSINLLDLIVEKYNIPPDVVLIEQQFINKFNKGNTHNVRMMQHIQTYFKIKHPDSYIKIVPTGWKTSKNGCPKDEKNKKRWATKTVLEMIQSGYYDASNYIELQDKENDNRKGDDQSDAALIIEAVMKVKSETKVIWN